MKNDYSIGNLTQVRESAGMKQDELARRVTRSPAVISHIESGERPLTADELKSVTVAIGTSDALQLSLVLGRDWQIIPRPPLDPPTRACRNC
jgi:transcriptional regulator with XRE-family HTH domain